MELSNFQFGDFAYSPTIDDNIQCKYKAIDLLLVVAVKINKIIILFPVIFCQLHVTPLQIITAQYLTRSPREMAW